MTTYFTSDLHFGHKRIIEYCDRPWDNVEAMNDGLVERWNERVEPHDAVFILGDLYFGSLNSAGGWLGQLNGYKYLVPGNHDSVWQGHKNPKNPQKLHAYGISVLPKEFRYTFESEADGTVWTKVVLCHFPYASQPDYKDRDFAEHYPEDEGQWVIHGHVHTAWKVDREKRQFNVGVDVWDWRPVHEDTILKEIMG